MHISNLNQLKYLPYLLYLVVTLVLFHAYFGHQESEITTVTEATPLLAQKQVSNFSMLNSWHLFGISPNTALIKVKDNHIRLVGIIYHSERPKVIIMVNEQELVLSKGDKIDSQYVIQKIEPHRIIVTTNEGYKSFELFEDRSSNVDDKR
jgi:hypothetical protein